MELHKPQCCFVLILHRYSKTAHAKTRAKSRMALNNHRQLHALATLVQIYCKIRRLVQEARHSGSSVDTLVGRLMTRCCERDALVLGEIARRLQMKKRLRQPWGNLSKKDDRLYKCLAKSVHIKNLRDNSAINDFVRESFRCRAIAVVSARFGRRGFLPQGPVPTEILPYRVYGYKNKLQSSKHQRWCKEYLGWQALPKLQPYVSKLTDTMLKERCSVGASLGSKCRKLHMVYGLNRCPFLFVTTESVLVLCHDRQGLQGFRS